MIRRSALVLVFLLVGMNASVTLWADKVHELVKNPQLESLKKVDITQKLNEVLPLDTVFRDETGQEVTLGKYFGDKPVVLAFVYYECPRLCTFILNGLLRAVRTISFDAGQEYEVVAISFDHGETPAMAAAKKENYVKQYDREGTAGGWHFLTGDEASIQKVTQAAGFEFFYDPETDEFAHASAIMVLTPQGVLARYFYGIEYSARDLRLALVEASDNKIGSLVDQVLLFCFHYDPVTGKYGFVIMSILRLAAILLVVVIGFFVFKMLRRERVS